MITLEKLAGYEEIEEIPLGEVLASYPALPYKPNPALAGLKKAKPKKGTGERVRADFVAGPDGVIPVNEHTILNLKDENKKANMKINVLKNIAKSKDSRIAHLQAQVNNAEKKYTAAANELKQLQGEHQELQNKHQAVLNELETVRGDHTRTVQQLQEANNKADEAARKAETYKARLNKTIEYGKTLREDLSKAKKGLYGLGALAAASLAGNIYQANKN